MKKRVLLALTSTFLLASCQAEELPTSLPASEESFESLATPESSSEIIEESSEQDDGLDEIFLTLEDNLKPFVKGDKNGLKINPVGDDPLFKLSFKTNGTISGTSSSPQTSEDSSEEPAINSYGIELNCEESTIETFNRTKSRGYCNRMTFKNAEIDVVKEDTHVISLNQTYVGYLAQTEIAGTDPKEYENGIYIDLSKALLSRVTFAPLFDQVLLPAKNYYNADTLFGTLQNIFPMATTMNTLLPSALDLLKSEVRSGALTLDKETKNNIENYKIHKEVESKEALRNSVDDIIDLAFQDDTTLNRADIDNAVDMVFDYIQTISGDFEINFNENEFENVILNFNIKLDDIDPDDMQSLSTYFSLNEFIISGKVTLMDTASVNYSTYPTDLQNHNTWKELTINNA